MPIEIGDKVKVHYTGRFDDGTLFDTTENKKPFEFVVGANKAIAGFDVTVMGMEIGEEKELKLPPLAPTPPSQPIQNIPRSAVPADQQIIGGSIGFTSNDGKQVPATIKEIDDENITIDLNHPLAGKSLVFTIKIASIRKKDIVRRLLKKIKIIS